jgi:hypothetical protein
MRAILQVVIINALIVSPIALLVARGNLSAVPWVPITWVAVLAFDAIYLRKVGLTDHPKLSRVPPVLLNVGKVFMVLFTTACISAVLSSGWRIASGRAQVADFIQIVGAAFLLWLAISTLVGICKRRASNNNP